MYFHIYTYRWTSGSTSGVTVQARKGRVYGEGEVLVEVGGCGGYTPSFPDSRKLWNLTQVRPHDGQNVGTLIPLPEGEE